MAPAAVVSEESPSLPHAATVSARNAANTNVRLIATCCLPLLRWVMYLFPNRHLFPNGGHHCPVTGTMQIVGVDLPPNVGRGIHLRCRDVERIGRRRPAVRVING